MLFRQSVVEYQQVGAVVDGRAPMGFDQPAAQLRPFASLTGRHQGKSRALIRRPVDNPAGRSIVDRRSEQAEIATLRKPVDLAKGVTAMYSQILQLHGPSARVSGGRQPFVERPVAVVQLPFHEHLTHDGVDERRVHAVAAEIARPRHPGRERLQSVEPAFEASTAEFHPLKFEHAGQTPRREGDLEIVSARIGIEVEHLAGEIEPFDPERLHRVLVHLVAANAAGRHDRVFEGGIVRNREHHTLQQLDKPLDLGLGDLADIVFEWMSSSFASGMTSGLGTSFRNSSGEEFVGLHLLHLAADAVAQHLLRQRRLHIQLELHLAAVDDRIHGIAAQPQRDGALDTALRESDLAELLADGFIIHEERHANVLEQQALQVLHLGMSRDQRRQRRPHRFDRMPQVGGEEIAVARGTRGRIAHAAGRDDHARALLLAGEAPLVDVADTENLIAERKNLRHAGIVLNPDAVVDAILQQGVGDIHALPLRGKTRSPRSMSSFTPCRSKNRIAALLLNSAKAG